MDYCLHFESRVPFDILDSRLFLSPLSRKRFAHFFFSFKIVSYKVIVILSKFEEIWTGSAAILWTYNGA